MPDEISLLRMLNELVRTPLADLDKEVSRAIGTLAAHVGAGWGTLFRLDGTKLIATHRHVADGFQELPCPPDYMMGAGRAVLEQNRPLLIDDIAKQPADSPLRAQDLAKAHSWRLPINGDAGLIGVLAFAFAESKPDLPPFVQDQMKAAAEVLETVIARRDVERAHLDTARRLEATLGRPARSVVRGDRRRILCRICRRAAAVDGRTTRKPAWSPLCIPVATRRHPHRAKGTGYGIGSGARRRCAVSTGPGRWPALV